MIRIYSRQTHRVRLIRGMSYGAISGIFSAHCLLLAKSAVELLVRTIVDHVNQFNRWQSWMILVGLVILALLQLYYLHRGLKLCSTSALYPFVFCIYNIIAILDGLIYFDQSSRLPVTHAILITVGTIVLLGGVFALSWRLQADDSLPGPTAIDIKAKARVPTPRTILQPGMGLAEEPDSDYEESPYLRPADDEELLQQSHSSHTTEHTPLLRTKTGPMRSQHQSKSTDSILRPPKLRRMTTIQDENTDLWDELNDRGDNRRFSEQHSPHSVRSPGLSKSAQRRSISGPRKSKTLPTRRTSSTKSLPKLPWRLLNHSEGKSRASREVASPPPFSEPTDGEDTEGELDMELRRNRWLNLTGDQRRRDGLGRQERPDWFKLKWWKKRWRNGDGGDTGSDV